LPGLAKHRRRNPLHHLWVALFPLGRFHFLLVGRIFSLLNRHGYEDGEDAAQEGTTGSSATTTYHGKPEKMQVKSPATKASEPMYRSGFKTNLLLHSSAKLLPPGFSTHGR